MAWIGSAHELPDGAQLPDEYEEPQKAQAFWFASAVQEVQVGEVLQLTKVYSSVILSVSLLFSFCEARKHCTFAVDGKGGFWKREAGTISCRVTSLDR